MTEYGWYYEEGSVEDTFGSLDEAIEEAVTSAAAHDRLHAIRVGPMCKARVAEVIDEQDVIDLFDGELRAARLLDLIAERYCEQVTDASAALKCSSNDADAALSTICDRFTEREMAAGEILRWAEQNVALDPSEYCSGVFPLPLEYDGKRWALGGAFSSARTDSETVAVAGVTYEDPETNIGIAGWCWWAIAGGSGNAVIGYVDAGSLAAAKAAAEAAAAEAMNTQSATE